MSADWDEFLANVSWYDKKVIKAVGLAQPAGAFCRPEPEFARLFPKLTTLIEAATVTPVALSDRQNLLFAWSGKDRRMGWLCEEPFVGHPRLELHPDHLTLLRSFGGITERFNEPASWLLNLNSALTEKACTDGIGSWDDHYRNACYDESLPPSVVSRDYIGFAIEANGNLTLYHRETGDVLMFATDHAFKHISVFERCPPYTYYTINGCPTLRHWIERVAAQWLAQLA